MFKLKDILRWFGVTLFEITLLSIFIFIYTITLTMKLSNIVLGTTSWWFIHSPLFIGDSLLSYFCLIVFIRQYLERTYRVAVFRALWSFNQILLLFLFKLLLCFKLEGQKQITTSEITSPVLVLLILLLIRACQLL